MEDNSSGQKFIPYQTNYLIMTDKRYQGGIHVIDISSEKAPTEALWYDNGTGYLDIDYDESSEILYGFQSSTKSIVQIDVSDLNDWHFMSGMVKLPSDFQPRSFARNGTDLFVGVRGNPNVRMYSFANPMTPQNIDRATSIKADVTAMTFFKGYFYVGSDQSLTIYKVTPSSSSVKNLPRQTTESQNPYQERKPAPWFLEIRRVFTGIAD